MTPVEWLLAFTAFMVFLRWLNPSKINGRLKERFATAMEGDCEWSQRDPMGDWEAHKDDKK